MKIILLGHPAFFSYSMNNFAGMILDGMRERHHDAEYWTPRDTLSRYGRNWTTRKWLSYIDQYVIFPLVARWRLRKVPDDALIVLTDHSLSLWAPLFAGRPHVIHSHDFIAQRGLDGECGENRPSRTGVIYQKLIRKGLARGNAFIAVSDKTAADLLRFYPGQPDFCTVVYNGLNYPYSRLSVDEAVNRLRGTRAAAVEPGTLMHIGGDQWYKNRAGVVALYAAYCELVAAPRPLVMIGPEAPAELAELAARARAAGGRITWLSRLSTEEVHAVYALSSALLFPSIEEGFGWPIIEAMACGTPVLALDRAPMSEIAGGAAELVEPTDGTDLDAWSARNAPALVRMMAWSPEEREAVIARGLAQSAKFSTKTALDQYEVAYRHVLDAAMAGEPRTA